MAVLANADRAAVWAQVMRDLSDVREACNASKAELRAVVDAIDDWVDANAASFNSAIPQPQRANLTAQQKARLLMAVVARRFAVA